MPIHDWTQVDPGIVHAFHHDWISQMSRTLNQDLLPPEYYALPEQQAAGFGPEILTLQGPITGSAREEPSGNWNPSSLLLVPPLTRFTAETGKELFRRKKSTIVVRHVSGDRMVAVVEVISPGNKGGNAAFKALPDKALELLEYKIHLLIIDLFPPTKRDPHGLHAALWEDLSGETFTPPADKPLTLAAYESGANIKAYIEPAAVGDALPDMPLFLEPGAHVLLPLEKTYQETFAFVPLRWRRVLDPEER